MFCDSHTHSVFSFDGHDTVADLCRAAADAGMRAFALTDHFDIDGILDGYYAPYDATGARRALEAAQIEYEGKLRIVRGIEFGQPWTRPQKARDFLWEMRFDFVIGACHNLSGVPDFCFLDYSEMPDELIAGLYRRMLQELMHCAAFPGVTTIAHLTYPLRYIVRCGRRLAIPPFEDDFRRLFAVMLDNGTALELNTKGIRIGAVSPEVELWILRLWRDCGGRDVTLGSDAHRASEMGAWITEGGALIRRAGFRTVLFPGAHGAEYEKI